MSEVIDRAVQQLGYTATKEHQRTVVEGLVGGKDVFGILPTGYGKSLCYACLDQLEAEAVRVPAIVLVVTPLTAIMDDQVWRVYIELYVETGSVQPLTDG